MARDAEDAATQRHACNTVSDSSLRWEASESRVMYGLVWHAPHGPGVHARMPSCSKVASRAPAVHSQVVALHKAAFCQLVRGRYVEEVSACRCLQARTGIAVVPVPVGAFVNSCVSCVRKNRHTLSGMLATRRPPRAAMVLRCSRGLQFGPPATCPGVSRTGTLMDMDSARSLQFDWVHRNGRYVYKAIKYCRMPI